MPRPNFSGQTIVVETRNRLAGPSMDIVHCKGLEKGTDPSGTKIRTPARRIRGLALSYQPHAGAGSCDQALS